MIEEKQVTIRTQRATEGCWLYQDDPQGNRAFTKSACLGVNAEPWSECTNAEKEAWEAEHAPQVEDIEPDEPTE